MARHVPAGYASEGQGSSPLATAVEVDLFRSHGMTVTLERLGSATNVAKTLHEGAILFGNLAAPGLVRAVAEGADLALIAGGVNQQFLVGAPGVGDLPALRGAKFAASRPGDLGDFLMDFTIRELFDGQGTIVYLGEARESLRGLIEGTAQAASLTPPVAIEAKRAGCGWLLDYADYGFNFAIGGVATTRRLLREEPNLVQEFLHGYLDGTQYYKTHRDVGVRVHEKYGLAAPDIAAETYDVTHAGFRDVPDPATSGMERLIQFWKDKGNLPPGFSMSDVVDSEPVLRAVAAR